MTGLSSKFSVLDESFGHPAALTLDRAEQRTVRWPSVVTESTLSAASLSALMRNRVLAVRIPGFLNGEEIEKLERAIDAVGIEYYVGDTKAASEERKGKIGPNLYRFKDDLDEYFKRVQVFETRDKPVLFREVNVVSRLVDTLNRARPGKLPAHQARSARGVLSSCTVRSLPSAPPHNDWIRGELPSFDAFALLLDQFAWNVYISMGDGGGETLIFDTEDRHAAASVDDYDVLLAPQPGDLVLFRARNVHAVRPTQGDRITVSGFWGPTVDGGLQYWV